MNREHFKEVELWWQTTLEIVRKNNPDLDLSTRQMAILLSVFLTPEPHTVKGLARDLNISKPAVSRALDRLSVLGFLKRQPDSNDRRSVLLYRTVKGALYVTELGDIIANKKQVLQDIKDEEK